MKLTNRCDLFRRCPIRVMVTPLLLVLLVLGSAACDKANPTAPSRVTPSPTPLLSVQTSAQSSSSSFSSVSRSRASARTRFGATTSNGATVTGVVNGGAAVPQSLVSLTSTMTVSATVPPGITATTDVDALGRFTLSGIPVGDLRLDFSVSDTKASLLIPDIGPGETIELAVTVVGTTATIETLHRTGGGGLVELDGRISELDVVARTLQVGVSSFSCRTRRSSWRTTGSRSVSMRCRSATRLRSVARRMGSSSWRTASIAWPRRPSRRSPWKVS